VLLLYAPRNSDALLPIRIERLHVFVELADGVARRHAASHMQLPPRLRPPIVRRRWDVGGSSGVGEPAAGIGLRAPERGRQVDGGFVRFERLGDARTNRAAGLGSFVAETADRVENVPRRGIERAGDRGGLAQTYADGAVRRFERRRCNSV